MPATLGAGPVVEVHRRVTGAGLGKDSGMSTVAELLIESLADYGVTTVWGVVGDALNPVTDAIRREDRIEWIGVRHEEVGAFAASAQAQLTGGLAVCMGTVGPGAVHLLNGLYDAKKSHAPVLAICGQVPREEMGTEFFQEVDNDALFADVAVFNRTVTTIEQLPMLIEQAGNAALQKSGVAVLTLPGDVGGLDLPRGTAVPKFVDSRPRSVPAPDVVQQAASLVNGATKVTLLVGQGAREARDEVLQLAERLSAPMVLTLKAKEGLERDNAFEVGQSGLLGNPATATAFDGCDLLFLIGTDFPYRDFLPSGKTVIQLDVRGSHIGRRTPVDLALVGDAALGLQALLPLIEAKPDRDHLDEARKTYAAWQERQSEFTDPGYDRKPKGLLRRKVDNPDARIRPELLAAALDRHAAQDAVFTTDTGMATVWLSRFVRMSGRRRLLGSFNLGSMANAMPQALGASALDRQRQVVAFCGDGGLSMLLGDLITAVSYDLPVKLVVFDNGRLGMVKLEMEQVGLPEYGTVLHNPDFARVAESLGMRGMRVERPDDVDAAVKEALALEGPVLLDVVTNPDEVAIPPSPTLEQGWGFAIAKTREFVDSAE
jgi:pyruvate dehydrogenase (quinone)